MSASHNIADLNSVFAEYQKLRRMTAGEALGREGGKLGREIRFQLLSIAPPKGAIRAEILQRLRSGKFIKIRDSVREKNELAMLRYWVKRHGYRPGKRKANSKIKNYQNELIKREIGQRESGRRVLGVSARHPARWDSLSGGLTVENSSISRYGQVLSTSGVRVANEGGVAQLRWSGMSEQGKQVLSGIQRKRAQSAITKAIAIRRKDMLAYIRRKHAEVATRTVRKMVSRERRWDQAAVMAQIKTMMTP